MEHFIIVCIHNYCDYISPNRYEETYLDRGSVSTMQ